MATNYEVVQGDCIYSISFKYGFFADTIWNHPKNLELKKQRHDPGVLMPGDVVFVPDLRLKEVPRPTGQMHRFQCKNTPKTLRIQFKYIDTPLKNMAYKIDIDGKVKEGKTDSGGWLKQSILPNAQIAKVTLADGSEFELTLGDLDPVDEVTGLQGRLRSLGLFEGSIDGQMDDETRGALKLFQLTNNLEVTGEADGRTRDLLIQQTGK